MKSATELLINKTYGEIWHRGEKYADGGKVHFARSDDKEVEAVVKGTRDYLVNLKFAGGGISRQCDCPYANKTSSRHSTCKHMVAVAILWDEARGIKRPSEEVVELHTIPLPLVSYTEIDTLYADPLNANLEVLRLASESGSWSRPHARLPNMPRFNADENEPLTVQEVRKAFREIARWAVRSAYDYYFCAGEMVAAFCEVMRIVKKRLMVTPPLIGADILREAQNFHYKLIMELIDDSDGLHMFTEVHLDDVYDLLSEMTVGSQDRAAFTKQLKEFDKHREDY